MKFAVLSLALGVCYISLPVASQVVAVSPAALAGVAPAVEEDHPSTDSAAADERGATKAEEPPAESSSDTSATPSNDSKSTKAEPAANGKAGPAETKAADAKAVAKKSAPPEKKQERQTAQAKKKRLRVVLTLDGIFTAKTMTPVALRPKSWTQFEIVEIVAHGTEVHAGQTLVKFDREKFDRELADLELQLHVSELAIRKAEEDLPRLEKSLALAASEAERNDEHAHEDYDHFYKIDRPLLLKAVEYSLKGAQFRLDYAQDELDQLEKMYEADDLTEETEEIILKRSRTEVDFARFGLEQTKQYCNDLLQIDLPRYEITLKESLDKSVLAMNQAKTALALDVNRARYELEQLRQTRAKSLDRHAKLLEDRTLLELKSPADGIVYYGECEDGNWSDLASLIAKLKPHGMVSPDTVVLTIVERRPLEVLSKVSESQRPELAVGASARIVPPVENAAWLSARLERVSAVPVAMGKFAAQFDFTGTELPDWIVAGMSCKVKVTTYDKDDAIVVPKKAVRTDKDDEELKYVWLVESKDAKSKAERRNVKLGKARGEDVEVTSGLSPGDLISLDDEEKKADSETVKAE